jgi:NADH:ubiquinone reductase (non-electrogenic)
MASSSRALTRLAGPQLAARAYLTKLPAARPVASIANITTTSCARKPAFPSAIIARARPTQLQSCQFIRTYADAAPAAPAKPVKKRKIRVFRWLWRFAYLYVLGGIAYIVYDGYIARHPDDQFTPDPNKKTLVVLGMCDLPIDIAIGARLGMKIADTCFRKVPAGAPSLC